MKRIAKVLMSTVVFSLLIGGLLTVQAQDNSQQKSTITLTEYSDYQCPACSRYHPVVEKLKDHFGDRLNLELRFFPLNSHQFSALAARAAQAAKNQGKFREMHNMLFENQDRWTQSVNPIPIFKGYAKKMDLDMEQFDDELNDGDTQRTVIQQKQQGVKKGVNGTPAFFIDGKQLNQLPRSYKDFKKIIQQHLDKKSG